MVASGPSSSFKYDDIPLDKLAVRRTNARVRDVLAEIDSLAHSMATFGLQQPIVVRETDGGKHEIIIGQRRYLAARELGWKTIPAKIETTPLDDVQALAVSFSENIQRRDLAPRDKAEACRLLLERFETPGKVAEYLGTTEQTVRKWLGYAAVPSGLKEMVEERQISVPEAMRLAQYIPEEEKAVEVARRMVDKRAPKTERNRIIAAAEEFPERPVDTIFRIADEKRFEKRITIILPEKWALALDRASDRLEMEPGDIAREAIIEWLESRRF